MNKHIHYLFISVTVLFFFSFTNKKRDDGILPKAAADTNVHTRITSRSIRYDGHYTNGHLPNTNNSFFLRYYERITPMPLIIVFHGGGAVMNDKEQCELPLKLGRLKNLITEEDLFDNGFAYASANYTLLKENDATHTLVHYLNDCSAFVKYMIDHAQQFNIDTNKIILMGNSAGASASLWIGLQNKYPIKGIVAINTQSTLNITEWKDNVFIPNGFLQQYDKAASIKGFATDFRRICKLYYRSRDADFINRYSEIHHLSFYKFIDSSDPELYMAVDADDSDIVHHRAHALTLLKWSIEKNHKARILSTVDPYYINPDFESVIGFCIRKFQ